MAGSADPQVFYELYWSNPTFNTKAIVAELQQLAPGEDAHVYFTGAYREHPAVVQAILMINRTWWWDPIDCVHIPYADTGLPVVPHAIKRVRYDVSKLTIFHERVVDSEHALQKIRKLACVT